MFNLSPIQFNSMTSRERMLAGLSGLTGFASGVDVTQNGVTATSRGAELLLSSLNARRTVSVQPVDSIDFRDHSLTNLPKYTSLPNSNTRPGHHDVRFAGFHGLGLMKNETIDADGGSGRGTKSPENNTAASSAGGPNTGDVILTIFTGGAYGVVKGGNDASAEANDAVVRDAQARGDAAAWLRRAAAKKVKEAQDAADRARLAPKTHTEWSTPPKTPKSPAGGGRGPALDRGGGSSGSSGGGSSGGSSGGSGGGSSAPDPTANVDTPAQVPPSTVELTKPSSFPWSVVGIGAAVAAGLYLWKGR